MYLDAQPLMGFGFAGLGDLLDLVSQDEAVKYNAKAANTVWTTPHLGSIIDRFPHFALVEFVAVYQKTKGLKVDGKLGPRTAASIEASAKGISSGFDAKGFTLDSVDDALQKADADMNPLPGTWAYAFANDEAVSDPQFSEGMKLFHNFKAIKSSPKPRPKPQPNPFPIPPVKQAGLGSAAYFIGGGVLLFLAYRSAMGKPLNPFGK